MSMRIGAAVMAECAKGRARVKEGSEWMEREAEEIVRMLDIARGFVKNGEGIERRS